MALSLTRAATANLLGTGLAYPVQRSEVGGLRKVSGEDLVKQSIREILDTPIGEGIRAFDIRNGVPYGTRMGRYLFENVQIIEELANYEIKRALDTWEPRVVCTAVYVTAPADARDPFGRRTVLLNPQYILRATNRPDNLVVPVLMRTR